MKLKAITLINFRCYQTETHIVLDDLTALIGQNDCGKSTILEALEIFFNNQLIKIEQDDRCIHSSSTEATIGCIFEDIPSQIVLDASAQTNLKREHLLNRDGDLEIQKTFDYGTQKCKEEVYAKAYHPSVEGLNDLLNQSNANLKRFVREVGLQDVDLRNNPEMRHALWSNCSDLQLEEQLISLNKEDGKKVWSELKKQLPIFALFQADRPSKDEDSEVQDPMKLAVKEAIRSVEKELEGIKQEVMRRATDVAEKTLDKLREMAPALANELAPRIKSEPKWDTLFKLSLTGDNDIPINKRGSGTRRLILLNFFRAEAERRRQEENSPGVIYAIEEPETSQHPINQKMIVEALLELSQQDGCQVLLTSHVPGLVGLLPIDSIRFIEDIGQNEIVQFHSEAMLSKVACELGVFPNHRLRLLVCVEGPTDVIFLEHVSSVYNSEEPSLPRLTDDPRVALIPLGGSTLKHWVNGHYLRELGLPEIHIYDKGNDTPPKYEAECTCINDRGDKSIAFLTDKNEMENYIHPDAIERCLDVTLTYTDLDHVPKVLARKLHEESDSQTSWDELTEEKQESKVSRQKKRLMTKVVPEMKYKEFLEQDTAGEIKRWLQSIGKLLSD